MSSQLTVHIFKSDFPFLSDHVRPSGKPNKNDAREYSISKIMEIKVSKATK